MPFSQRIKQQTLIMMNQTKTRCACWLFDELDFAIVPCNIATGKTGY